VHHCRFLAKWTEQGKMFVFEKKNQKTFAYGARLVSISGFKNPKVFRRFLCVDIDALAAAICPE
jgi:hypothetical protein